MKCKTAISTAISVPAYASASTAISAATSTSTSVSAFAAIFTFTTTALSLFISGAIFICFLLLSGVSGVFILSGCAYAATGAAPLFEVPAGSSGQAESGKLGEWVVEEDITDYDKFYFPAAFCSDDNNGMIFVLDSAKNRICAFSKEGKPAGEIKIPYEFAPVDFAWISRLETFFVAFSESPHIAVLKVELKNKFNLKSHKLALLEDINGRMPGIQNIWPSSISKGGDAALVISFNGGYEAPGAVFSYKNDIISRLRDINEELSAMAVAAEYPLIYGVYINDTIETGLISMDINSAEYSKIKLPAEFLTKDKGMQCVSCRPAGIDGAGNIYIEAHFSSGESSKNAYVYKFDKNMRQIGKTEIFTSPEMLTNRFIYIDPSGAVYYMKLDINGRKIQFYRFAI